jgi:nicotinamidase-related amidase
MSLTTKITAERRAPLLIDFQRDFLESSGKMPVARDQLLPVLSAAAQAIVEARSRNDLVVAIGNEFRPGDFLMNALRRYASVAGSEGFDAYGTAKVGRSPSQWAAKRRWVPNRREGAPACYQYDWGAYRHDCHHLHAVGL